MQKLLEVLKEDFLVVTEKNAVYQPVTSIDGDIIIFDNFVLDEPLTIDMLCDEDDDVINVAWLADLTIENCEIVDWVIRSATAADIERTKYLNEILAPYFTTYSLCKL